MSLSPEPNSDLTSNVAQPGNIVVSRRGEAPTPVQPVMRPEASINVESTDLIERLRVAAEGSKDLQSLLRQLELIISSNSDCLAVWFANRETPEEKFRIHSVSSEDTNSVLELVGTKIHSLVNEAAKQKQIVSSALHVPKYLFVAAPMQRSLEPQQQAADSIMIGCFSVEGQSELRQQWLMGIVSQTLTSWFQEHAHAQLTHRSKCLNDALSLNAAMNRSKSSEEAAMILVNHLRQMCNAEQVAYVTRVRDDFNRLVAISDVEQIDECSESAKTVCSAAEQSIDVNSLLYFPDANTENSPSSLAFESYCRANRFEACVNVPVQNADEQTIGAMLIAVPSDRLTKEQLDYFNQISTLNGAHLDVINRANLSLKEIAKKKAVELKKKNWFKAMWIGIACLIGLMAIPMPYRVGCECEIQPVTRRFIAAPYNGILERSVVEAGDIVEQGQVLAYMDGRQLRMELSALEAEHAGAKRRRDSSLAKGEVAQSQIARSEMKRISSKIALLTDQLTNLEIRSPHRGMIVSGDLEKAEGAPLELGQTLFEVAPLDAMLSEVAIPESEIQYVKEADNVKIKLTAFPFKTWSGTIKKINPRTEIINDESVFIAEVEMPSDGIQIRPGMKGSAKIKTRMSPIGWNLFHSAWESIRCWMIW
jgi:hypothetical protein